MKSQLQEYVSKEISVLETGSIIQTHTGEDAWAILIMNNRKLIQGFVFFFWQF